MSMMVGIESIRTLKVGPSLVVMQYESCEVLNSQVKQVIFASCAWLTFDLDLIKSQAILKCLLQSLDYRSSRVIASQLNHAQLH